MKVSVFGLGYVGCVSVACLAKRGHYVIGVDMLQSKVDSVARGRPTVIEPKLESLLQQAFAKGRVSATQDPFLAIRQSDVSLICVGTPAGRDGCQQLDHVADSAREIGQALHQKKGDHLVVLRSTVPPGTARDVVLSAIQRESGRGPDQCCLVVVPEFLREGTAVDDYDAMPLHVVGTGNGRPSRYADQIAELVGVCVSELRWVEYREAELMKSVCNTFHALKVAFANEVGAVCAALEIDGHNLMRLVCEDRKLNISPAYLQPGLPFGGSCLPKDVAGIVAMGNRSGVDVPLIRAVGLSNESHKKKLRDLLCFNGHRRIGLEGLAFKSGTDDLRQSPLVELAEHLIGKGYDLKILDTAVDAARLHGANREFIEQHIPHLASRLVSSAAELVDHSEVVIVTRSNGEIMQAIQQSCAAPKILDLSRFAARRHQHTFRVKQSRQHTAQSALVRSLPGFVDLTRSDNIDLQVQSCDTLG